MERQENNQTFANDDYIRVIEFDYFWNQQFIKPYEKIIGGGNPVDPDSRYGNSFQAVELQRNLYWVDLGIVGLSMVIGIPAVLCLVYLYVRCIWRCKEKQIQYIRFTFFIVLIGSIITNMELYREGNLLMLSLFLYIEYKYHQTIFTTEVGRITPKS